MDKIVPLFFMMFSFSACQNTPCRDLRTQKSEVSSVVSVNSTLETNEANQPASLKVKIYKADGSLQCNMGKRVPILDMKKQLKGITIFSQATLNDGLMRIQVCGAPTGESHVFEIAESDLQRAIKLGFKQWTSN
jgi:hypothetical protein